MERVQDKVMCNLNRSDRVCLSGEDFRLWAQKPVQRRHRGRHDISGECPFSARRNERSQKELPRISTLHQRKPAAIFATVLSHAPQEVNAGAFYFKKSHSHSGRHRQPGLSGALIHCHGLNLQIEPMPPARGAAYLSRRAEQSR